MISYAVAGFYKRVIRMKYEARKTVRALQKSTTKQTHNMAIYNCTDKQLYLAKNPTYMLHLKTETDTGRENYTNKIS